MSNTMHSMQTYIKHLKVQLEQVLRYMAAKKYHSAQELIQVEILGGQPSTLFESDEKSREEEEELKLVLSLK